MRASYSNIHSYTVCSLHRTMKYHSKYPTFLRHFIGITNRLFSRKFKIARNNTRNAAGWSLITIQYLILQSICSRVFSEECIWLIALWGWPCLSLTLNCSAYHILEWCFTYWPGVHNRHQWRRYTRSCQVKWPGEKANDLAVDLAVKHLGKIIIKDLIINFNRCNRLQSDVIVTESNGRIETCTELDEFLRIRFGLDQYLFTSDNL